MLEIVYNSPGASHFPLKLRTEPRIRVFGSGFEPNREIVTVHGSRFELSHIGGAFMTLLVGLGSLSVAQSNLNNIENDYTLRLVFGREMLMEIIRGKHIKICEE